MERYPPNRASPKFRCRMYPTVTQRPFSPPSFPARRKRRGRRRRVRNDHDGTSRRKRRLFSSVLVSSFPNRKLNLRFGFFHANLQQPLSLGCAEPAPLEGEPFVVCIYIGGGQCYTVYIMVFSERNDIHGSACKAGTLTTEFL